MHKHLPFLLLLLTFSWVGMLEAQSRRGNVLNTFGDGDGDRFGATVSISNNGNRIAVMAPDNGSLGTGAPRAEVYELQGGTWVKLGDTFDDYATSPLDVEATIALSGNGNTVATGEPAFNSTTNGDAGRILAARFATGSWRSIGNELTGTYENARLGKKIVLIENGAQMMTANFGGAASDPRGAFNLVLGQSWSEVGTQPILQSSNELSVTGIALSEQGLVVGVGLDKGANAPGEVQLFQFAGDWVSRGNLTGSANGDGFGESIAMASNGQIVAVGAPNDGTGKVRVYGTGNAQLGSTISGATDDQAFGYSIDISESGSRIAIGAPANDPTIAGPGRVYVYDLVGDTWTLEYTINGTVAGENAGQSVSLSNDGMVLAIGRPGFEANGQSDAGQVDVLVLDGSSSIREERLLDVVAYPNPTTNVLNVSGVSLDAARVHVRDALGRLSAVPVIGIDMVDVKGLTDGYYFLEIQTENGVGRIPFVKE